MIISTKNLQQAKNQIKSSKHPIVVRAQNQEFNRKILEYGKFDVLLDIQNTEGKDKLKQLNSGLNHVLAKIAAKNKVAIGIDLSGLRSIKDKKQKAKTLARIKANIQTCRKAKCLLTAINYKDKKDALELLISLGASTQQAKEATAQ
ncbi:MAG: hypothetical protein KKD18_03705 [Nanoarchaeota archaeon]|nr:hypothetical protein [Nanoarchaeota archaeon]MBU0977496.1 hypothetical protein [Nanoarchaeota archaeon]